MDGLINGMTRPPILQPQARVEGPCRRNPVWKPAPFIARAHVTHRMSYLNVFAELLMLERWGADLRETTMPHSLGGLTTRFDEYLQLPVHLMKAA